MCVGIVVRSGLRYPERMYPKPLTMANARGKFSLVAPESTQLVIAPPGDNGADGD